MTEPTFWAACAGAALQLPSAIRALYELGRGGSNESDADAAHCRIIESIKHFGEPIRHMDAWKHLHERMQTAELRFRPITNRLAKLKQGQATEFAADVRETWEQVRGQTIVKMFTAFSQDELTVVRMVDLEGEDPVDWIKELKKDVAKVHNGYAKESYFPVWDGLRDLGEHLDAIITCADRKLIVSIGKFAKCWGVMEGQLSHDDSSTESV